MGEITSLLGFLRHGLQRGELRRIELAVLVGIGPNEFFADLGRFLRLLKADLAVAICVQVLDEILPDPAQAKPETVISANAVSKCFFIMVTSLCRVNYLNCFLN